MCGIAGEIRWDGARADRVAVERMTDAMAARGPDDSGLADHGRIVLGHRRLSIIDVSEQARQPMVDDEIGLTLVFNGCIYNHVRLRNDLIARGHRFRSTGDTEVILRGWAEWGDAVIERLDGMFAFCITEHESGRTFLVRDRLGIKPLCVSTDGARVRFASSLPALLASGGLSTELDPVAIHHYLTLHGIIPAPRSILQSVRKVPPATVMTIEPDGRCHERTYWTPKWHRDPADASMSDADWTDAVRWELQRAVREQTIADVPIGVLLSGGVDSSVIVALLAESGVSDIATFSIGFEDSSSEAGDEFRYSDLVASIFDADHHRVRIRTDDVVSRIPEATRQMSEPMASHDAVAFFLLSEVVSREVKVVQSGQGADELFGGYDWHRPFAHAHLSDAADVFEQSFFDRHHCRLHSTLVPDHLLPVDVSRDLVCTDMARPGVTTALDAVQRLDVELLMPDDPVKRVDNMTMASGLEARVPFLDHRLVELAARCPSDLKLADGGKGVLKSVARQVLPACIIDRPKGYFPLPALRSMSGDVLELSRDVLCAPQARARGLLRRDHVDALLDAPMCHRTPSGASQLWQLTMLELWLQTHVDR